MISTSLSTVADTIQIAIAPVFPARGHRRDPQRDRRAARADRRSRAHRRGAPPALDRPRARPPRLGAAADRRADDGDQLGDLPVRLGGAGDLPGRRDPVRVAAHPSPFRPRRWRVAFILSMLLLMGGLVLFLIEVRMSRGAIHVREETARARRQMSPAAERRLLQAIAALAASSRWASARSASSAAPPGSSMRRCGPISTAISAISRASS